MALLPGSLLSTLVRNFRKRKIDILQTFSDTIGIASIPTLRFIEKGLITLGTTALEKCEPGLTRYLSDGEFKCYDSNIDILCGNTLYRVGYRAVTSGDYVCTDCGVINKKIEECCAGKLINVTDSFCCNGEEESRSQFIDPFACCGGTEIYNIQTHKCCAGKKLKLQFRGSGVEACCGSVLYNFVDEKCCEQIHDNKYESGIATRDTEECCYGQPFNRVTQICTRSGNVLDIEMPSMELCGLVFYDPSRDTCCQDVLYEVPESITNVCCADKLHQNYNPTLKCCGRDLIDPNSDKCCESKPHYSVHDDTECCGLDLNVLTDHSTLCCNQQLKPATYGDDTVCCVHQTDHDAPTAAIIDNRTSECCGGTPINRDNEVCCPFNKVAKREHPSQTECCYDKLYDPTKWRCHDLNNIVSVDQKWCGNSILNPDNDMCCDEVKRTKFTSDKRLKECCGIISIDPRYEKCFFGMVIRKKPRKSISNDSRERQTSTVPPSVHIEKSVCASMQSTEDMNISCNGTAILGLVKKIRSGYIVLNRIRMAYTNQGEKWKVPSKTRLKVELPQNHGCDFKQKAWIIVMTSQVVPKSLPTKLANSNLVKPMLIKTLPKPQQIQFRKGLKKFRKTLKEFRKNCRKS